MQNRLFLGFSGSLTWIMKEYTAPLCCWCTWHCSVCPGCPSSAHPTAQWQWPVPGHPAWTCQFPRIRNFPETWWELSIVRCRLRTWELPGHVQELKTASQELWVQVQYGLDSEEIVNRYHAIAKFKLSKRFLPCSPFQVQEQVKWLVIKTIITITEYLQGARHDAKYLSHMILYHFHNTPER